MEAKGSQMECEELLGSPKAKQELKSHDGGQKSHGDERSPHLL